MPKCPENSTDDGKCYCDGPGCQADKPNFDFVNKDVGDFSKLRMDFKKVEMFLTCTACWQRLNDGEEHVCSKPRPDGKVSAVVTPGYSGSAIPKYVRDLFREREVLKAQISMLEQQLLADRLISEVLKEERDRLADEHLRKMCARVGEIYDMKVRKDDAYTERNRCVAAMARMALRLGWKAGLKRTAIEGWDEEWHGCVWIDFPTGQAAWHYHDSHAHLFEGLPPYEGEWDGHTTPQKYERLEKLT